MGVVSEVDPLELLAPDDEDELEVVGSPASMVAPASPTRRRYGMRASSIRTTR